MEHRIESYVNDIFGSAPDTFQTREVKSEIIGNTIEKYHELKAQGMDDESAYSAAIASIGNAQELIYAYASDERAVRAREEERKYRQRRALLLSVAVALYIMSVVPVIMIPFSNVSICIMFVMIAVATGLIIYRASIKPSSGEAAFSESKKEDDAPIADEQRQRKKLRDSVSSLMWTVIVILYIVISFYSGAWHITWVIFLIGGAAGSLMDAIYDYKDASKGDDNGEQFKK